MDQILLLSSDLLFGSRVAQAAGSQGVLLKTLSSPVELSESLLAADLKMVILDLSCSMFEVGQVMQIVADQQRVIQTVAFGSHVQRARLQAARQAGFDQVVSNGQFSEMLPQLFTDWITDGSR